MTEPIVLYDIPAADGSKPKSWSANIWKVRFTLNYKGIAHRTEWVEYPDIESVCKTLGAPATEKKPDGQDFYTLPVIYDPSTKKIVADSSNIVKYLEETYPGTPELFPPGLNAFQAAFVHTYWTSYALPILFITVGKIPRILNPRSREYFIRTRQQMFGPDLGALDTPEQWERLERSWGELRSFFSENGPGKDTLLTGDRITYSDIVIASVLVWARASCGAESTDWKRIAGLQNGFWAKFLQQFDKYEVVDA